MRSSVLTGRTRTSTPDARATGVVVAEYDSVYVAEFGWIGIHQFLRDPDGSLFVSGTDARGDWVDNVLLPAEVSFSVR